MAKVVLCSLFIIILSLWITGYVITNILQVVDEFEYSRVTNLLIAQQHENMILRNRILEGEALINIASKSAGMGFIRTTKIYYLR